MVLLHPLRVLSQMERQEITGCHLGGEMSDNPSTLLSQGLSHTGLETSPTLFFTNQKLKTAHIEKHPFSTSRL